MSSEHSFDAPSVFEEVFGHKYHPDFFSNSFPNLDCVDDGKLSYTKTELVENMRRAQERVYQHCMDMMKERFEESFKCIDFFRSSYENMKEINSRFQARFFELDSNNQRLEIELHDMKKKNTSLEEKIVQNKNESQKKLFGFRTALFASRQLCSGKDDVISYLEKSNAELKDQNDRLIHDSLEAKRENTEMDKIIDDLSVQIINLTGVFIGLKSACHSFEGVTSEYLSRHFEALMENTRRQRKNKNSLEKATNRISSLIEENTQMQAQITLKDVEIEALRAQVQSNNDSVQALEERCALLSARPSDQEIDAWRLKVETLEADLAQERGIASQYQAVLGAEREKTERMSRENERLATDVQVARAAASDLREQLDAQAARADKAERVGEGNLRRFEQEKEQLRGSKRHLEERNKELVARLKDVKSALSKELEKTLKEFAQTWERKTSDIFTRQVEIQGKVNAFFALQREYNQTCEQLKVTQDMLEDMQDQCCRLKDQSNECTPQKLAELHAAHMLIKDLSSRLKDSAEQNDRLLKRTLEMEKKNQEMDVELREIRIENNEAHRMFNEMKGGDKRILYQKEVLKNKLLEANEINAKLELKLQEAKEYNNKLHECVLKLSEANRQLQLATQAPQAAKTDPPTDKKNRRERK